MPVTSERSVGLWLVLWASQAGAQVQAVEAQRRELELAYQDIASGQVAPARAALEDAAAGPDPVLAARAQDQLVFLPRHFWSDLYADSFGWSRVGGPNGTTDLVPTLRVRGHFRPDLSVDAQVYMFAQATRDAASHGPSATGLSALYADNYALLGAGLLARLAGGRVGLFAQAGPAVDLLDDGHQRTVLDVRAGAFLSDDWRTCRPGPVQGVRLAWVPCLEGYGEAVYVYRFNNNIIGFARGRLGATWLVTGPVAWQPLAELRAAADVNGDYWNNFFDAGLGHRWRWMGKVPVDVFVGAHAGRYVGRQNVDPIPSTAGYADFRLLASTYMEF